MSGPGLLGTNGSPRNPSGQYNGYFNFYEWANTSSSDPNKPQGKGPANNNTFTLYRAEVATYMLDITVPPGPAQGYIPNLMLFHTSKNAVNVTDMKDGAIIVEDPNFFYDNSRRQQ